MNVFIEILHKIGETWQVGSYNLTSPLVGGAIYNMLPGKTRNLGSNPCLGKKFLLGFCTWLDYVAGITTVHRSENLFQPTIFMFVYK